jgi:hypothetical protein
MSIISFINLAASSHDNFNLKLNSDLNNRILQNQFSVHKSHLVYPAHLKIGQLKSLISPLDL